MNTDILRIHKQNGRLYPLCRKVTCEKDIPQELLNNGAVSVNGNKVTMHSVEGIATRQFPFFLTWNATTKTPSGYGAYPKDNGDTTLIVDSEGHCYNKAPVYIAYVLEYGKSLPKHFATIENVTVKDGICKVATRWGEVKKVPMPTREDELTGVLIDYRDGSFNLITLTDPCAKEYIVQNEKGEDIGFLVDILHNR